MTRSRDAFEPYDKGTSYVFGPQMTSLPSGFQGSTQAVECQELDRLLVAVTAWQQIHSDDLRQVGFLVLHIGALELCLIDDEKFHEFELIVKKPLRRRGWGWCLKVWLLGEKVA